jgi:hypothetical protein
MTQAQITAIKEACWKADAAANELARILEGIEDNQERIDLAETTDTIGREARSALEWMERIERL